MKRTSRTGSWHVFARKHIPPIDSILVLCDLQYGMRYIDLMINLGICAFKLLHLEVTHAPGAFHCRDHRRRHAVQRNPKTHAATSSTEACRAIRKPLRSFLALRRHGYANVTCRQLDRILHVASSERVNNAGDHTAAHRQSAVPADCG